MSSTKCIFGATLLFIGMSVAMTTVAGDAEHKRQYVYRYLLTGDAISIDEKRSAVFFADLGMQATFCSEKSPYHCVSSTGFHFAVPKNLSLESDSWELNGHGYKMLMPQTRRMMFGQTMSIGVIESSERLAEGVLITRYYYSVERGLLAFEFEGPHQDRTSVLLVGETGFGAKLRP